jgi:hypothetical protein
VPWGPRILHFETYGDFVLIVCKKTLKNEREKEKEKEKERGKKRQEKKRNKIKKKTAISLLPWSTFSVYGAPWGT